MTLTSAKSIQQRFKVWLVRSIMAVVAIPLSDGEGWQNLSFSKIPANKVTHSEAGLEVAVKASASPLIYPLKKPIQISSLSVKGEVNRLVKLAEVAQGEKGADDFVLRVGFVIPGGKSLNWAQRMVAADWVLKLFSLAPKGSGVDHIYFLNLGQVEATKGREREHPLSDLIKEKNEWVISEPGMFELSANFSEPKTVAAVWISIDGDDTKSEFVTKLKSLELTSVSEN